jgi:AAA ATPase domain/AAA domain, putative AbiEii toxin, Type IV TA system
MIHKLTLRNFKSIGEQSYDFSDFDLLVGRNNSGKSTVLQALAIWQFCVDQFSIARRSDVSSKGIQVILPNFTALPVPEFRLLWKDQVVGQGRTETNTQKLILIEILVCWRGADKKEHEFGVGLRYQTSQTLYAVPTGGWAKFRQCEQFMPKIAYVPPFSGLEPTERRIDDTPVKQQVGKGQPGSVLRNLLLRVCPIGNRISKDNELPADWLELVSTVERWFAVTLSQPLYQDGKDVHINVEYQKSEKKQNTVNRKGLDIIAGGSGFHQTLTLLAFFYGYKPTTILLDEPDAHLHVNLQREVLDYFKKKSAEKGVQFLIATHAEEFAKGVDANQILSLLKQIPTRIRSTPEVLRAMADVSNEEITRLMGAPYILYIEGESDERILRAWAEQCGALPIMDKLCFKVMGGGSKLEMKKLAEEHFSALKQIVPDVRRLMLFDYDSSESAFHPDEHNPALVEWARKNIENYLLVPAAWRRAVMQILQCTEDDLFADPILQTIDRFFADENLALPSGKTWRNVSANIFSVVDGKKILFENDESLFHILRNGTPKIELLRERVAAVMTEQEIHENVHLFFNKLIATVNASDQVV